MKGELITMKVKQLRGVVVLVFTKMSINCPSFHSQPPHPVSSTLLHSLYKEIEGKIHSKIGVIGACKLVAEPKCKELLEVAKAPRRRKKRPAVLPPPPPAKSPPAQPTAVERTIAQHNECVKRDAELCIRRHLPKFEYVLLLLLYVLMHKSPPYSNKMRCWF